MKTILLLINTERFSFPLIRYLVMEGRRCGWKTYVGSMFHLSISSGIKKEFKDALGYISITDFRQCDHAIKKSDIIIGLLPDIMLVQVVNSCIAHKKTLITPNKLNETYLAKREAALANNSLLLFECGFSPGLDHVTAKKAIDNIHAVNGKLTKFETYSGSFIQEDSATNPWQYKLTEPASEVIDFGKSQNCHIIQGNLQQIPYHKLFRREQSIYVAGLNEMVAIPEGDALYYRSLYELDDTHSVIKGKLVRRSFSQIWNLIINLGLTDNTVKVKWHGVQSYYNFLNSFLPSSLTGSIENRLEEYIGASAEDIEKLKYLGLFDDHEINCEFDKTPADLLQQLMEKKLSAYSADEDCIVMRHHLEYNHKDTLHSIKATFIGKGENKMYSAIAKAKTLVAGVAAKACLIENIKATGVHVPASKLFYEPILQELDDLGLGFHIERSCEETACENPAYMAINKFENHLNIYKQNIKS